MRAAREAAVERSLHMCSASVPTDPLKIQQTVYSASRKSRWAAGRVRAEVRTPQSPAAARRAEPPTTVHKLRRRWRLRGRREGGPRAPFSRRPSRRNRRLGGTA